MRLRALTATRACHCCVWLTVLTVCGVFTLISTFATFVAYTTLPTCVMATGANGGVPVRDAIPNAAVTTESSRSYNVYVPFDKLDGVSNYNVWKFNMKMTLIMEDLWSCIEGAEPVDAGRDLRALARISLALKPTCIQYVRNEEKAKQAWDNLSSVFEDKGFSRRVTLLRKLHRGNYDDFNSMDTYIEHIMTLVQQLSDIGRTIEDAEVAELILSGLSQEYDIIVSSLEAVAVAGTISSELVRTRLLQEEYRKRRNDMALFSKQQRKKVLVCHYCHRSGHVKTKCFKLKKDMKNPANKDEAALVANCFGVFESSDFIMDSGATAHMCKDIKWFTKLEKCNKTVCVADGTSLTCLGCGEVSIPMKNNKIQIVTKEI